MIGGFHFPNILTGCHRREINEMGKENVPVKSSTKMLEDLVMGGTAAIVAKSGAAPMERVKLLLQNQGEMMKREGGLSKPYAGIGNCAGRVFREEGVLAFWRGNQANVIRYFPTQAFNFAFKNYFRQHFGCSKEKDGNAKWLACNVASGSAAGAMTSLCFYHLDYARTQLGTDTLESQVAGRQFKGLADVYRKTISSDGFAGLYRGFGVSLAGITLYRGMYFGIYDTLKPIVLVESLEGNFIASFMLGWSVTTMSSVCAYPFDTLRRRMMLTSGQPSKYRNAIHAFRHIIHHEGFLALFRGATANVLSEIAGAGVLSGYDQLQRIASRNGYIQKKS